MLIPFVAGCSALPADFWAVLFLVLFEPQRLLTCVVEGGGVGLWCPGAPDEPRDASLRSHVYQTWMFWD